MLFALFQQMTVSKYSYQFSYPSRDYLIHSVASLYTNKGKLLFYCVSYIFRLMYFVSLYGQLFQCFRARNRDKRGTPNPRKIDVSPFIHLLIYFAISSRMSGLLLIKLNEVLSMVEGRDSFMFRLMSWTATLY